MLLRYLSALDPCKEILPDWLVRKTEHILDLNECMSNLRQTKSASAKEVTEAVPAWVSSLSFTLCTETDFH